MEPDIGVQMSIGWYSQETKRDIPPIVTPIEMEDHLIFPSVSATVGAERRAST